MFRLTHMHVSDDSEVFVVNSGNYQYHMHFLHNFFFFSFGNLLPFFII